MIPDYVFRELTYFLHGPGEMPIIVMLNFNGFKFPKLYVFPEFAHHFSSPGYDNLPIL
jgi:hypothetical protein